MTNTARRRSRNVTLGVTGLAAAMFLTGCGETADYAAICVDPDSEQRVDDDECDEDQDDYNGYSDGFFWYYVSTSSSARVPAVGETTHGLSGTYKGSTLTKSGKVVMKGGVTKSGGSSFSSVSKSGGFKSGGFGSSSSRGFSSS